MRPLTTNKRLVLLYRTRDVRRLSPVGLCLDCNPNDALHTERDEIGRLNKENAKLQTLIAAKKEELVNAEKSNGKLQVALPGQPGYTAPAAGGAAAKATAPAAAAAAPAKAKAAGAPPGANTEKKEKKKKEKKEGGKGWSKEDGKKAKGGKGAAAALPLDVTRLDLRVARIVTAKLHPDADGLYLEDAETGEPENRVVISGLVGKVPLDEMQNRMVVLCMNLKPVKMKGIFSTAMVMCANEEGKGVEIIDPPAGSVPGDIITVAGYSSPDKKPDVQLKPKKKVLEQLLPDLFTSATGQATYKGIPWVVEGKGECTCKSMFNAKVK